MCVCVGVCVGVCVCVGVWMGGGGASCQEAETTAMLTQVSSQSEEAQASVIYER